MREQLLHLVTVGTTLPRVRIHVVPLSAGAYSVLDGNFLIATPTAGEDIVYLEGPFRGEVLDRPEDVRMAVQIWESIRGEALPHQQSIELISEIAETWT